MKNLRCLDIFNFIVLLVFWYKYTCADYTYPCRMRRSFVPWLIVPPTAPTRHQLIVGFGVPVVLSDHSVTIGFVIKGQYFLPTCVDQLKPDFFWFNDSRKFERRSVPDNSVISSSNSENYNTYYDAVNQVNVERYVVAPVEIDRHTNENINDNIITDRPKISSDNGETTDDSGLQNSRLSVYKTIEGLLSYNAMEGHKCLLKTICELSETKITYESGILGELINVLLIPSSTSDRVYDESLHDYHQAELNGKSGKICSNLYSECSASLSDIFSRIHQIMTAR